jgi:hypothetical protein
MLEDLLDHLFVLNKSEDSHLTLALGAGQGVHLIDFLNQSCPVFPVLLGSLLRLKDAGYDFIQVQLDKKVAALVFKMNPVNGYQVEGTFLGFQTSGALFDRFAKEIKERIKLSIKALGTIKVDEVYSIAPPQPGKKIA